MKLNRKIKKRLRNFMHKGASFFMAFLMLLEVTYPTQVWALTGGPSQPEVQSFEPIGTSDMVDLFSGDFNYNIPLMDVEGYPINIAYHSGIGMDQEASWVGLGWNINPGVVNRNMRGLPDDFSGENVVKEINMKPNKTWGVGAELNLEVYGYEGTGTNAGNSGSVNLGASFAFSFNNYTGPSISQGVNLSLSAGNSAGGGLNAGLGINSSSDDGLTIQPNAGFSARVNKTESTSTSIGVNIGTAFNSRGGLKQLSINASASTSYSSTGSKVVKDDTKRGQHLEGKPAGASMGSHSVGGTFDFGTPTHTPMITNSMKNYAISGKFTLGGELFGINGKIGVNGFFSTQKLASNTVSNPAYGYLYSEQGQTNDNALMDFNREKDGNFMKGMATLPLTNYTFDTYSVMGQGIGGSYRPFRSDVGYMFDPAATTTNDDASLAVEIGLGNLWHVGTNISVTDVNGSSGKWKSNNNAINTLLYSPKQKGSDFENVYFKEANEKTVEEDPAFYAAAGYDAPISPAINSSNKFEPTLTGFGAVKRKKRDKRTQNFYFLTKAEYNDYAVNKVSNSYSSTSAPSHHIAEVTTLGTDGSRYVYGIAAYNTVQEEVTFAIGSDNPALVGSSVSLNPMQLATEGTIDYSAGSDNSLSNTKGIDNFFSKTTTPAYAHSYLLTSVLSPDYIDADATRGPSDGDFGNYTRFAYKRIQNYKWRTPFGKNEASYTEGMKSDLQDDKANYIYGEKELWYLDSVITKNYVAVFHTSPRKDGVGVDDQNGGYGSASKEMYKLDSISLYTKTDLRINGANAQPIKRVHFEYDYTLCPGIPNVVPGSGANGKLTLKSIYFTYQNSHKARLSPYKFTYAAAFNKPYSLKAYDRWGNFKPNTASAIGVAGTSDINSFRSGALPPSDFPYVEQDQLLADEYAASWSLTEIKLPSGGKIKLTYESDDYAYVQNKQAMQMFKVTNVNTDTDMSNSDVSFTESGDKFYFKLQNGITDINKYIAGISNLYFRFLVKIRNVAGYDHYEYISGYGEIDHANCGTTSSGYGYVKFKDVLLEPKRPFTPLINPNINPIVRTAVQYARLYMPKKAYTSNATSSFAEAAGIENSNGLGTQILDALINSSFIKNIKDAALGPNSSLYSTYNVAKQFVAGKSWVRLLNPNKKKLGGGVRVRKIEMVDEWDQMTSSTSGSTKSEYGQEYSYTLTDGSSSGVASYEPQLGGDENPFRQPLPYDIKKTMVPDDEFYQEEPLGESFFPSPSVGYSRVVVKNIQRAGVTRHATGAVVHEFYTAKDFPTITKRTGVNTVRGKDDPFSIRSLLKINVRDYMTAAQGFVVELNDMHGKPKSQAVYQENQSVPISTVTYKYKQQGYLDAFKLNNKCTTIDKSGNISTNTIGEFFDMVADFREEKSSTMNISLGVNIDGMLFGVYPAVVPSVWPSFAKQHTRFRSATTTKVIQRFGILDETIATDLGSTVATKNIAYDAETGGVLLTETTTNFNDKVYSFKYPAWWYYTSMGPAYQNIGFEMDVNVGSAGTIPVGSQVNFFREGDELAITLGSTNYKGWITNITGTTIQVVDKAGVAIPSGAGSIKVIRSGKRNTITTDMATITTLSNPISSLQSNIYQNVLQAGAVEFDNKRKTYCNCIGSQDSPVPATTNPYITGEKGNWRPLKSHTHLTGRSQSNYNTNTNIRKDGVFTSYTPFYKWVSGGWQIDPKDWTYVSEVTAFNVFGEELENKDALGRYSSATFGYNQAMALSVAANSKYSEQGFDGFEDYDYNPCMDDHFKFTGQATNTDAAHTGRNSIKVSSGNPKILTKQIAEQCKPVLDCDIKIVVSESDFIAISVQNAQGPLSASWDIISGTPQITPTGGGLQINGCGYILELTITDSKGCTATKMISKACN